MRENKLKTTKPPYNLESIFTYYWVVKVRVLLIGPKSAPKVF